MSIKLNSFSLSLKVPYMTIERYASETGDSIAGVRRDIESGVLPCLVGSDGIKRHVNVFKLFIDASSSDTRPVNHDEKGCS